MGSDGVILLDTQIWLWMNDGNPRLSSGVALAIAQQGGVISSVSVWEVMMLFEKGRSRTDRAPEAKIRDMLGRYPFEIISLNAEIALLSRSLLFEHEDPADRFIAATAHRLKMPLATSDARLLALPWLKTIS